MDPTKPTLALLSLSLIVSASCAPPVVDPDPDPDVGRLDSPYREVWEQGLTRYVDAVETDETDVTHSALMPNIDVHHFSGENRGPSCMYGGEFFVESREGDSDTLMIFLQGGGVCLDEICAATPAPILSLRLFSATSLVGIGGVLDPRNPNNPTRDFDIVNAPYCDGSLYVGDVDRPLSDGNPNDGDDDMAFQRGLQNLTATLKTAHRYYPDPPRIVMMGSSGGAYGILAGVAMTRYFYPDTPLLAISDSGAPIVNGVDRDFIQRAMTEIGAIDLIPESCPTCLTNGHTTGILEWALERDPNLSIAYMTHSRDHVIGEFFMGTTADEFEAAVVEETQRVMDRFPGRAFRFVIPGSRHTLAMGLDRVPDGVQGTMLGLVSRLNVGFVGDDVDPEELSTWALGGLTETGVASDDTVWVGYDWLRTLLEDPASTPDVLQLD